MSTLKRFKLVELNSLLVCRLCDGYFVEATTINDCMHTFCKSCIVLFLKDNNYCPECHCVVNSSRLHDNLRQDKTLQDVLFKLVPGLFDREMARKKAFFKEHPAAMDESIEQSLKERRHFFHVDDKISLSLEFLPPAHAHAKALGLRPLRAPSICLVKKSPERRRGNTKDQENTDDDDDEEDEKILIPHRRYLLCPAAVQIKHLEKFIRQKYELSNAHRVDIVHGGDCLLSDLTLLDVVYMYKWTKDGPLSLQYTVIAPPSVPGRKRKEITSTQKLVPPLKIRLDPCLKKIKNEVETKVESREKLEATVEVAKENSNIFDIQNAEIAENRQTLEEKLRSLEKEMNEKFEEEKRRLAEDKENHNDNCREELSTINLDAIMVTNSLNSSRDDADDAMVIDESAEDAGSQPSEEESSRSSSNSNNSNREEKIDLPIEKMPEPQVLESPKIIVSIPNISPILPVTFASAMNSVSTSQIVTDNKNTSSIESLKAFVNAPNYPAYLPQRSISQEKSPSSLTTVASSSNLNAQISKPHEAQKMCTLSSLSQSVVSSVAPKPCPLPETPTTDVAKASLAQVLNVSTIITSSLPAATTITAVSESKRPAWPRKDTPALVTTSIMSSISRTIITESLSKPIVTQSTSTVLTAATNPISLNKTIPISTPGLPTAIRPKVNPPSGPRPQLSAAAPKKVPAVSSAYRPSIAKSQPGAVLVPRLLPDPSKPRLGRPPNAARIEAANQGRMGPLPILPRGSSLTKSSNAVPRQPGPYQQPNAPSEPKARGRPKVQGRNVLRNMVPQQALMTPPMMAGSNGSAMPSPISHHAQALPDFTKELQKTLLNSQLMNGSMSPLQPYPVSDSSLNGHSQADLSSKNNSLVATPPPSPIIGDRKLLHSQSGSYSVQKPLYNIKNSSNNKLSPSIVPQSAKPSASKQSPSSIKSPVNKQAPKSIVNNLSESSIATSKAPSNPNWPSPIVSRMNKSPGSKGMHRNSSIHSIAQNLAASKQLKQQTSNSQIGSSAAAIAFSRAHTTAVTAQSIISSVASNPANFLPHHLPPGMALNPAMAAAAFQNISAAAAFQNMLLKQAVCAMAVAGIQPQDKTESAPMDLSPTSKAAPTNSLNSHTKSSPKNNISSKLSSSSSIKTLGAAASPRNPSPSLAPSPRPSKSPAPSSASPKLAQSPSPASPSTPTPVTSSGNNIAPPTAEVTITKLPTVSQSAVTQVSGAQMSSKLHNTNTVSITKRSTSSSSAGGVSISKYALTRSTNASVRQIPNPSLLSRVQSCGE